MELTYFGAGIGAGLVGAILGSLLLIWLWQLYAGRK